MELGLQVMAFGLAGVFTVLVLFYVMIVGIKKLFPYREDKNND